MKAQVFKHDGGKASEITLSSNLFGQKWNADLIHEVVVVMEGNARAGTADTKDRGEVRGGGKKPWKQKGTGRARHGSRRSPIWTGGGIAHGPLSAKDYSRKLNKKVRAKALAVTLSKKYADGEVVFVEALSFSAPKAAEAKAIIKSLAEVSGEKSLVTKRKNTAVIVLPGRDEATEKSFRNFGNFEVVMAKDVNPVNLLTYKYVIVTDPKASLETLEKRVTN
jgi:large subunit ribosomal protein L4